MSHDAPGPGPSLSAEEYRTLARSQGLVCQLFMLDDFWTREARASRSSASRDRMSALGTIVDDIDGLLGQLAALTPDLAAIFRAHRDDMRTNFEAFAGGAGPDAPGGRARLTAEQGRMLRQVIDHQGGDPASAAADAADRTTRRVDTERQALRSEFERVAAGYDSGGDMSQEQWTDLALVAAGASVLFGPEAAPVVMGAGALVDLAVGLFHSIFG